MAAVCITITAVHSSTTISYKFDYSYHFSTTISLSDIDRMIDVIGRQNVIGNCRWSLRSIPNREYSIPPPRLFHMCQ